jgi:hypothetical protein
VSRSGDGASNYLVGVGGSSAGRFNPASHSVYAPAGTTGSTSHSGAGSPVTGSVKFKLDVGVKCARNGQTAVWMAAAHGTAGMLRRLLEAAGEGGLVANEPDATGESPLIALVRRNDGDAVERLTVLLTVPTLHLGKRCDTLRKLF